MASTQGSDLTNPVTLRFNLGERLLVSEAGADAPEEQGQPPIAAGLVQTYSNLQSPWNGCTVQQLTVPFLEKETEPHTLGKHMQDRADLNTQLSVRSRLPAWEIGQGYGPGQGWG